MMELLNFFKVLLRHKLILTIIPVIAVVITYFLVRSLPNQYISQSRLATGIVDDTQQMTARTTAQDMRASQEFDNLIQMMTLKRIVNQVSYTLIIHDLTEAAPFRSKSTLVKNLNQKAIAHALDVYRDKYKKMQELSLWNEDERGLYKVLESMRYDYASLMRSLRVYRAASSDFITVEFESENPDLSAFAVNLLCREFIGYYTLVVRENQNKAINYLDSMLRDKEAIMKRKMAELKDYKIRHRVLNLNEQAKSLYSQIADFETKREIAKKDVAAYSAAMRNIDRKFDPADRRYMENALTDVHQDIERMTEQLKMLNQAYISSNFDPSYKTKMDALQSELNVKINSAADKYAYDPLSAKENLVSQKLSLETTKELAENSIGVLNEELVRLNKKQDALVPNEAEIEAYQNDIEIVSREYIELLAKYNQASMESGYSVHLRQVEIAMPGTALPSKKMLLVILSGIISFGFCVVVFFVLFMIDRTIRDPGTLASRTGLPVVGTLNLVDRTITDFGSLWVDDLDREQQVFKDLVRAIRFELERDILEKQGKTIVITSLVAGEGKTFLTVSLAYAFRHINKKVLIIDGNFLHPSISETVKGSSGMELYFKGEGDVPAADPLLGILGNKGGDVSPQEVADIATLTRKLDALKGRYDVILIEAAPLTGRNIAKEWLELADKVVAVFEAGRGIGETGQEDVRYLKSLGDRFSGWVLNKVPYQSGAKETGKRKKTAQV